MQTPVERAGSGDSPQAESLRQRIHEILESGGRVALPTETVYGIAARADDASAIDALRASKDRPEDMALTWHVAGADALELLPSRSLCAERLVARYWPGPLTLVLPGVPERLKACTQDDWIGVRAPAHEVTRSILASLDFPVVMTSANRHGEPPAKTADEAALALGDQVQLVVDGGPARLGEASTVLRLGRGKFEILRSGLIDLEALRSTAGLKLAFVCTGNTCRSPMAESLARKALAKRLETTEAGIADFGFSVRSMGVFAGPGSPASDHSVTAMKRRGLDLSQHRSTTAEPENLSDMDRIYGLTHSHVDALQSRIADVQVEVLDPEGRDVPDPFGGSLDEYLRCADAIEAMLAARMSEWV